MSTGLSTQPGAGSQADPRPVPAPDETTAFFWAGAADGRLLLQRCARCMLYQYPPDVACVHCQSTELAPTAVSGRGSLYSYTRVDRAFHAGFTGKLPYVIGLIEIEEQPGLKVLTNIVDVDPEQLKVGMPLEVTFETRGDAVLPQFRPATEPGLRGPA
jgi:uncharacterized protein